MSSYLLYYMDSPRAPPTGRGAVRGPDLTQSCSTPLHQPEPRGCLQGTLGAPAPPHLCQ